MMVLKCCLLLGHEFGVKTGMEDDLSSYGKAFNLHDPLLLVPPDLDTDADVFRTEHRAASAFR